MGLYIYNCNSFVIKNDCSNHIYYISRIISVLMWTPQTDRLHCILKNYNILHIICASVPSQCSLYHVAYRLHVGIRIMTVCASATVAMLIISYSNIIRAVCLLLCQHSMPVVSSSTAAAGEFDLSRPIWNSFPCKFFSAASLRLISGL